MGYLAAFGDDTPIIFNSTKYPGTCKPSDTYTLGVFKGLQQQLNRVAQARGIAKIAVDGDIGPGTVALANKTLGAPASCTTIASNAVGYTSQAKLMADAGGVPATVAQPQPIKAPSIVNAAGQEVAVPSSSGVAASVSNAFAGMSNAEKLVAVAIVGGIAYVTLFRKKKTKGRRS